MSLHNTRDCPCAQWCVTYGIMPGEYHHRNCKHWHRDMEAVQTKTEIIVLGTPESDDETHNCDAMGCSSVSHVLFRLPLVQSTALPATEVMRIPLSYGPLDANALERFSKENPDQYFLKGSGVLKLIAAIRELEQRAAALPMTDQSNLATIAGLEASSGHLSAMVDELRVLLGRALANFKTLHSAAKPDDGPDMNAIIPAGVLAAFVDEDAALRHAISQSSHHDMIPASQPKLLTFEALNAVRQAHQNKRTDDYFEARPQIDNTDRRRVFENGYKRGFDDGMVFQRDHAAALLHAPALTHPTADMQIAGGAVELDYTGVQTAPNTVGWLTAARVWLAMERARLGDGNEHASIANPYQPGTAHSQGRIIGGHQP